MFLTAYSMLLLRARRKHGIKSCKIVGWSWGGSIHSTLPDDEINWAFDRHPNKRIDRITKV